MRILPQLLNWTGLWQGHSDMWMCVDQNYFILSLAACLESLLSRSNAFCSCLPELPNTSLHPSSYQHCFANKSLYLFTTEQHVCSVSCMKSYKFEKDLIALFQQLYSCYSSIKARFINSFCRQSCGSLQLLHILLFKSVCFFWCTTLRWYRT